MLITLDIETLPSADPAVREILSAKVKPPGTLKKAESIAKWEAEEKSAAIDEAVARTGLDGTFGQVCVIGLKFDADMVQVIDSSASDERTILQRLMRELDERIHGSSRPVFVGHNIHGFDLPFLWKRCVIHKIKPSPWIPFGAKAWSERIADTMLMWDDNRDKRINLDTLCKVLNVPTSKGDLDGGKVAEAWAAGRYADIAAYCAADVTATYECYRRMTFQ